MTASRARPKQSEGSRSNVAAAGRLIVVLLLALGAGAVWATVLVDFTPAWFDRLPPSVAIAILISPLALHGLCGLAFPWWRWRDALIYSTIAVALDALGSVTSELRSAGNLSHAEPVVQVGFYALLFGMTVVWWWTGHRLRERIRG